MWSCPRDERGATIVLVAFMIVGLFGFLAVAVDLSRIIVSKNQMQLAADAGALAAAVTVLHGDTLEARDTATSYALANFADPTAMAEDGAISFGLWDPTFRSFEPREDASGTNAIQVQAARSSPNLVAWIFGSRAVDVRATAIAVFGATVTETSCMKPFAVARELIDVNRDGVISAEERDQAVGRLVTLRPAEAPEDAPSFYYSLVLPPFYDASEGTYVNVPSSAMGAAALRENIAGCFEELVGVGDSLLTKPGGNVGPVRDGLEALCGGIDPGSGACLLQPEVIAPLWDSRESPIGRTAVGVTDVAAFRILQVILGPGSIEIRGYFVRQIDGGAAEPGVGLVQRPILVR